MIKMILVALMGLSLVNCTAFYTFKREAAVRAEQAADELLADAMFVVCKGSTVGAIDRRFRTDQEKASRKELCPDE